MLGQPKALVTGAGRLLDEDEESMATQKYAERQPRTPGPEPGRARRGDVRQASEKGWGAAAQMVKAIAEQRGVHHRGHALLYDVVSTLAAEAGDDDIDRLFELAGGLHTNFYEDWYGAGRVERGLRDVERFLDKLEPLNPSIIRYRFPPHARG
ncbi:hypothetical protein GBAR_LOCUS2729 [Geodia barretti]|uniref:Uncharacterized protein n=1 Tax=Geodia barretti TaxID=519541 RepID=A0AA35VZ04_GEOBA|nr:hypothetical protein GBAR_LOCUS2729 [Geodia barretti]